MGNEINWFPGHMTKALRAMKECAPLVDAFIYVLDARAAFACLNPALDEIVQSKPVLYLLNKADLVEKADALAIVTAFKAQAKNIEIADGTSPKDVKRAAVKVKELCGAKIEKYALKGVKTTVRAMVLGVPNSGKSTIINSLKASAGGKGAAAITGNKPGVTRGRQWVKIDDYFEVLDTPGTLYPKLNNQQKALRLAYIGSINDDVLDTFELAQSLANELDGLNPAYLKARYNIVEGDSRLEGIAKSRGLIRKGGVLDIEKAASVLIDDFRKGRLGKIALETK